jgi:hypothetical protein
MDDLIENGGFGCGGEAALSAVGSARIGMGFRNIFRVECYGPDGALKWAEEFTNLVVNEGLNHALDVALSAGAQITAWYVGLKGAGTVAAADTMASHAGWSELTPYSNAARPQWVDGGVSGQSVSNSASVAVFNVNAPATVAGALLASNNVKGGATGTLYGAGDFSASRSVISGDSLNVTVSCTASAV